MAYHYSILVDKQMYEVNIPNHIQDIFASEFATLDDLDISNLAKVAALLFAEYIDTARLLLHPEAGVVHLEIDGGKTKMKTNGTGLCDVQEWLNGYANL